MDPDAALRRYWSAVARGDSLEARDAKRDLKEWLSRGGFQPNWSASGHTKAEFMSSSRGRTVTAKEIINGARRR